MKLFTRADMIIFNIWVREEYRLLTVAEKFVTKKDYNTIVVKRDNSTPIKKYTIDELLDIWINR